MRDVIYIRHTHPLIDDPVLVIASVSIDVTDLGIILERTISCKILQKQTDHLLQCCQFYIPPLSRFCSEVLLEVVK